MKRVLSMCEKHGFLKTIGTALQPEYFQFGPAGEFLSNNVRQEWLYSNVISREENVFPFQSTAIDSPLDWSGIKEAFLHAKSLSNGQLPFGLANMQPYDCTKTDIECSLSSSLLNPQSKILLRSLLFVTPSDARQCFYTWQQNRKMWWRKFSSYPGRFSLSDIKEKSLTQFKVENDFVDQRVDILVKFDWGVSVVEKVQVFSCNSLDLSSEFHEDFKARDGRKSVSPCVVESVTSLEEASLVFLMDAYSETSSLRRFLRLHRRLAPYKVGFVASLKDASTGEKVRDLAQHLSVLLRRSGLTTLLLPDMSKKTADFQLARNNEMAVPFTVVLTDSCLTDGIVQLYSRETTLKEQVHISQLTKYLELLMKNY